MPTHAIQEKAAIALRQIGIDWGNWEGAGEGAGPAAPKSPPIMGMSQKELYDYVRVVPG